MTLEISQEVDRPLDLPDAMREIATRIGVVETEEMQGVRMNILQTESGSEAYISLIRQYSSMATEVVETLNLNRDRQDIHASARIEIGEILLMAAIRRKMGNNAFYTDLSGINEHPLARMPDIGPDIENLTPALTELEDALDLADVESDYELMHAISSLVEVRIRADVRFKLNADKP